MTDTKFEVTYVGPFTEGVEEGHQVVLPGQTIEVDEERAAQLTEGDAWKLAHPRGKKPTPADRSDLVEAASLVPAPTDVHENPPTEEPASSGEPAPTEET